VLLKGGRAWVLSWLGAAEEHRRRMAGIRSLLAAPLRASEAASVNERLGQLRASTQLRNLFEQQWLVRHIDAPFAVVYLLVLLLIGGWLVLIPVVLAPGFLWQGRQISGRIATALRQKERCESFRNDVALACLQGAPTVKALNLEGFLVRRLEPAQEAFSQAISRQEIMTAQLQNLAQLYAQWSQLLIGSFGGWMVINQNLTAGALAACTLLSSQVTMPLSRLLTAEAEQAGILLAQEQVAALAQLAPEPLLLRGDPVPATGELSTGALQLAPGAMAVLVEGLPHQSTAFLESLTALDGPMPPDLRFAGRSPATMERSVLRQRLRLVCHGTPLWRGTILDHLTQFRSDARAAHATLLCDRHGVAPMIHGLPRGYDTPIGESQDFPLPPGLVFRLQVIQALMDEPAALLIDASAVPLSTESLTWLLALELTPSRLVALPSLPGLTLPAGIQLFRWQGEQLQEVAA